MIARDHLERLLLERENRIWGTGPRVLNPRGCWVSSVSSRPHRREEDVKQFRVLRRERDPSYEGHKISSRREKELGRPHSSLARSDRRLRRGGGREMPQASIVAIERRKMEKDSLGKTNKVTQRNGTVAGFLTSGKGEKNGLEGKGEQTASSMMSWNLKKEKTGGPLPPPNRGKNKPGKNTISGS